MSEWQVINKNRKWMKSEWGLFSLSYGLSIDPRVQCFVITANHAKYTRQTMETFDFFHLSNNFNYLSFTRAGGFWEKRWTCKFEFIPRCVSCHLLSTQFYTTEFSTQNRTKLEKKTSLQIINVSWFSNILICGWLICFFNL